LQAAPFQVEQQLDPVLFTLSITVDQADDVFALKENLLWVRDFETIERLRPLELCQRAGRITPIKNPNQNQGKSDHTMRADRMNKTATAFRINGMQHNAIN
jgi:hypothetical protein